jgi:hypothetical protein
MQDVAKQASRAMNSNAARGPAAVFELRPEARPDAAR